MRNYKARRKSTRVMRAARLRCQAEAQGRVARLTASCVGKRLMGATPRRAI
jgi:hypothetical protein